MARGRFWALGSSGDSGAEGARRVDSHYSASMLSNPVSAESSPPSPDEAAASAPTAGALSTCSRCDLGYLPITDGYDLGLISVS